MDFTASAISPLLQELPSADSPGGFELYDCSPRLLEMKRARMEMMRRMRAGTVMRMRELFRVLFSRTAALTPASVRFTKSWVVTERRGEPPPGRDPGGLDADSVTPPGVELSPGLGVHASPSPRLWLWDVDTHQTARACTRETPARRHRLHSLVRQ